ncbi:DUF4348 domain-containing protein [Desertivirga brevis]|uniref:DUF4348 domain-containing protein n=1 Tax=Desertivirga brevis TaxID=2810310 RepID=UPI001A972CE2|nr:DUF4348 domain-containing protein [Pedobacter sp. SYSU D00873]
MFTRYFIPKLILVSFLSCCADRPTSGISNNLKENYSVIGGAREAVDSNFNDFIEKFSSDTAFQISRTRFPLKVKWYNNENDRDSLIYKDRSAFEMIDFRKKKSDTKYDKWEQKRMVDKATSARIEIRGIDNGIMVDYLFEKIKGAWMLIEIDDDST